MGAASSALRARPNARPARAQPHHFCGTQHLPTNGARFVQLRRLRHDVAVKQEAKVRPARSPPLCCDMLRDQPAAIRQTRVPPPSCSHPVQQRPAGFSAWLCSYASCSAATGGGSASDGLCLGPSGWPACQPLVEQPPKGSGPSRCCICYCTAAACCMPLLPACCLPAAARHVPMLHAAAAAAPCRCCRTVFCGRSCHNGRWLTRKRSLLLAARCCSLLAAHCSSLSLSLSSSSSVCAGSWRTAARPRSCSPSSSVT